MNLKYAFDGAWVKETVTLDGREDTTVQDLQIFNITSSTPYISALTDGFLGLAVGNEGLENPDYDLIKELKDKQIIDHYKFGLWVSSNATATGHLQLGDWNTDALLEPDQVSTL